MMASSVARIAIRTWTPSFVGERSIDKETIDRCLLTQVAIERREHDTENSWISSSGLCSHGEHSTSAGGV
jgi:hypothetical protein